MGGRKPLAQSRLAISGHLCGSSVYLPQRTEPSPVMRALAVSLIGMLVIANAVSLVELVRNIFVGVAGITQFGLLLVGIVL